MATISISDLIDINLLGYYDGKIKDWVADQIESSDSGSADLTITTTANLPEVGEEGKLYITEDAILVWDAEAEEYSAVGGTSAELSTTWVAF